MSACVYYYDYNNYYNNLFSFASPCVDEYLRNLFHFYDDNGEIIIQYYQSDRKIETE